MSVTLRDANRSRDDREWVRAVYPEYIEELSQVSTADTGMFPINGEHGQRHDELLARWFRDDRSHPLLILENGHPAGFALVSRPLVPQRAAEAAGSGEFRMAEFFVRRPYRRRGIGRVAASLIFSRFAGQWEVAEAAVNGEAVNFWRRTIMAYTHGRYDERVRDGEVRQRFVTSNSPGVSRP